MRVVKIDSCVGGGELTGEKRMYVEAHTDGGGRVQASYPVGADGTVAAGDVALMLNALARELLRKASAS